MNRLTLERRAFIVQALRNELGYNRTSQSVNHTVAAAVSP